MLTQPGQLERRRTEVESRRLAARRTLLLFSTALPRTLPNPARLKGKPLSLSPMYLQSDEAAIGLIHLLSIGCAS